MGMWITAMGLGTRSESAVGSVTRSNGNDKDREINVSPCSSLAHFTCGSSTSN